MARTDIATLAVKLTASATDFDKEIGKAEKRITGFMNNIASPANLARGIGGSLSSMILNPAQGLMTDISRLATALPGMGAQERLLDPEKKAQAMHDAFERTQRLAREAERIDVSPRFLRAIEAAAEDDAAAVTGALQKFQKVIGELKQGSKEAIDKFKQAGLKPADFVNATTEEAVMKFADHYQSLGDRALQASTAVSLLGKSGQQAHGAFKDGAESIKKYLDLLDRLGVYGKQDKALAETFEKVDRLAKLMQEVAEQRAFIKGGASTMIGAAKIKAGMEGGWKDWLMGHLFYGSRNAPWNSMFAHQPKEMQDMLSEMNKSEHAKKSVFRPDPVAEAAAEAVILAKQNAAMAAAKNKADTLSAMMDALRKQLDTMGMSELGIKVQEAALLGANQQEQDFVRRGIDVLAGDRLTKELITPMEKYEKELERINGLHHRGVITAETYERALKKMAKAAASSPLASGDREANVALGGGQDWAKAFSRLSGEGVDTKDEEQLKEAQRQTALQEEIERHLEKLNENKPKVLNAPP